VGGFSDAEKTCSKGLGTRDGHHVTLFFVLPAFQGRGIGRRLFDSAVERVRRTTSGATKLEVHSSPVAVPVYQALGFSVTGPETVGDGIRYIPMARLLDPGSNTWIDHR